LDWVNPVGPGVRWTLKNKILLFKPTARSNFCLLAPAQFSKLIPPFGGVDPVGPGVWWATQNKALLYKPTRGANFVCWLLLNCLSYYPHLVGWTLWAQGWSEPPQTEIYKANPPRGATFVCYPTPNYLSWYTYLVGWTLRGPWLEWAPQILNFTLRNHPKEQLLFAGPHPILIANTSIWWSRPCGPGVRVSPPKSNFPSKPTQRSNFCLLDPALLLTFQEISDGVTVRGTPGGWHFGLPPGYISYFISIIL
jgi:hypothetical protein